MYPLTLFLFILYFYICSDLGLVWMQSDSHQSTRVELKLNSTQFTSTHVDWGESDNIQIRLTDLTSNALNMSNISLYCYNRQTYFLSKKNRRSYLCKSFSSCTLVRPSLSTRLVLSWSVTLPVRSSLNPTSWRPRRGNSVSSSDTITTSVTRLRFGTVKYSR
jgi:hypothetical protein